MLLALSFLKVLAPATYHITYLLSMAYCLSPVAPAWSTGSKELLSSLACTKHPEQNLNHSRSSINIC